MAFRTKLAELIVEIKKIKLTALKSSMAKAGAIVKRGMKSMAKWTKRGIVAIGVGLVAALTYATKAAMKQEDAEVALAEALRLTGDATGENIERFKRYASAIQKSTTYGDEQVLTILAQLKTLGVHTSKLEEATTAVIAFTKMNIRGNTALKAAAALMLGDTTMLLSYIPALRTATSETDKLRIVHEAITRGFAAAEAETKTLRGRLKQLWNVIGDIAEKVGKPLADKLKAIAKRMLDWVDANEELVASEVREWIDTFTAALERLKPVLAFVVDHWRKFVIGLTALFAAPAIVALGKIVWTLGKVVWAFGKAVKAVALFGAGILALKKIYQTVTGVIATGDALRKWGYKYKGTVVFLKGLGKVLLKLKLALAAVFSWTGLVVAAIGALGVVAGTLAVTLARIVYHWRKIVGLQKIPTKERLEEELVTARKRLGLKSIEEVLEARRRRKAKEAAAKAKAAAAKEAAATLASSAAVEERTALIAKLEAQRDYYEKVGGYEKELAKLRIRLREAEAIDIAKATGLREKKIFSELGRLHEREAREARKEKWDEEAEARKARRKEAWSSYKEKLSILVALLADAVGYEKELAKEEQKLRDAAAKDISEKTGVSHRKALKMLTDKALRSEHITRLRTLEALYTDAKNYEEKLAAVKGGLRHEEAIDIARKTALEYKEVKKILDLKAIKVAKVGLVSFEAAWGQIATGAEQTAKAHLRIATEQLSEAKRTREILEKGKSIETGYVH